MSASIDRLAVLLDPENAPARHGEWHPAHRPMGEESVVLTDDDGCDLFVEPWEVAVMVNMAVDLSAVAGGVYVGPIRHDNAMCQKAGCTCWCQACERHNWRHSQPVEAE